MLRAVNKGSARELMADKYEFLAVIVVVLIAWNFFGIPLKEFGLGVTPDSVSYLSAADSLAHGRGLTLFDGSPMVLWPPLYPALLGLFSLLLKPMAAAKVINGLCLAGTIVAGWSWTRRVFDRTTGMVTAFGIAFSTVMTMSFMAWSEPLFIMLTVAGLAALDHHRSTGEGLIRAAIFIGLAALTRYLGVAVIAAGAVLVFFGPPGVERRREVASFMIVSAAPLVVWLSRNWIVARTLTGPRLPSDVELVSALAAAGRAVGHWAPAGPCLLGLAIVLALMAGGTILVLIALQAEKTRFVHTLLMYCLAYAAALVALASFTAIDEIGPRLVAPLFPAALMLMLGGLRCLPEVLPTRATRAVMIAGFVLVPIFFGARTVRTAVDVSLHGPAGYNRAAKVSPVLAWVREHPLTAPVYSNEPPFLYWATGVVSQPAPARHPYRQPDGPADDPAALAEAAGGTLVLFKAGEARYFTAEEINKSVGLTPLTRLADGAVYRISPRPRPEP